LYDWAFSVIKAENPDFMDDLLKVVLRKRWRYHTDGILNKTTLNIIEESIASYKAVYKAATKNYIKRKINEVQNGGKPAELLAELARTVDYLNVKKDEE